MSRFHSTQVIVGVGLVVVLGLLVSDHDFGTRAVARTAKGKVASHRLHADRLAPSRSASQPARLAHPLHPASNSSAPTAVVTLVSQGTQPVPRSFLGISTEYWTLPLFETHARLLERALSLIRTPGNGPLVMRVGGDSADHTFWNPAPLKAPRWVVQLGPRFLQGVGALVKSVGMRLILDLNLVTGTPLTAARWAKAADTGLPRGSIVGFEVGNEPDLYARRYWSWLIFHPAAGMSVLPKDLTAQSYARDFEAYSDLLAEAAPGLPLVGPAVAHPGSNREWISTLIGSKPSRLGMISGHEYPYSACARPGAAAYPTIGRVLSEAGSAGIARRIAPAVQMAHSAGLPFEMTELNSVTCGGLAGVSNTFATALWTPDALFRLLRAGVDAINVHVREDAINQAFALRNFGLLPRPLLYGLLLFDRTLGPGAQLVGVHLVAHHAPHLDVYAVRLAHNVLHVLAIQKGASPVHLDLALAGAGNATVERLLAPSVSARYGVTLGGQWLGRDARWHGRPSHETIKPGPAGYQLTVPRFGAALVTVRLAPRQLLIRPRSSLRLRHHARAARRR